MRDTRRRRAWAAAPTMERVTSHPAQPPFGAYAGQPGLQHMAQRQPAEQGPHFGTYAADHLPPTYPERAAWGTAQPLRAWQQEALDRSTSRTEPRDFLAAATPGAGKTTFALRLASELLAAAPSTASPSSPPPSTSSSSGPMPRTGRASASTRDFCNGDGDYPRQFHGVVVTYAQVAARPPLHERITRSAPTPRDPRRGAPRRRRAQLGRRGARGVRPGRPPTVAHRARRSAATPRPSRSSSTCATSAASASRAPTTPTATTARCATASCARCSSWPTPARCSGARRWATR